MGNPPALAMSGVSDKGRVREHNEDAIRWDALGGWAILADGMGGHLAGEVASALAIETIASRLSVFMEDEPALAQVTLREAVVEANRAIHAQAQADICCHNMGTTVVAVLCHDGWLSCAHVGDSRLYRFNAEGLALLSHDHSLVQELVDEGFLSREEAAVSVHKNVITRALGVQEAVDVDVLQVSVAPGDLFLLCSDGLSDKIPDSDLAHYLGDGGLDSMAHQLVAEANERGGEDNISVILLRNA
jgi:serine/threonine protein phosphatase PrpC